MSFIALKLICFSSDHTFSNKHYLNPFAWSFGLSSSFRGISVDVLKHFFLLPQDGIALNSVLSF